jgi:predicted homoserine dehydrogenase-like protein
MLLVDAALRRRRAEGRPVRVAMVGAGFMGRAIANQIVHAVPGMELAAIANRHADAALRAYAEAGAPEPVVADSTAAVEAAVARGRPVVCEDPALVCRAEGVDAVLEVTGSVAFGAEAVLEAIAHGKHAVVMNAELDGTLGPLLKVRADAAGVVYTASDGDQPGVQGNLHRYVTGLGLTPLLMGNVKGLHDPSRTPTTQAAFARRWGQSPTMVTSFADGTKISFEQATVATALGFDLLARGMTGLEHHGHVDELTGRYDLEALRALGGVVDYVVGARPGPGVFCLATHDDPRQRRFLDLYKLGPGPLYCLYQPYHLCHFEAPASVARAVLFADATLAPAGSMRVEVVAVAKAALAAGQVLDGIGGHLTYGEAERAPVAARERLLPMGVAEGCRLRRDVAPGRSLTYDDVERPPGRLVDRLRADMSSHFDSTAAPC